MRVIIFISLIYIICLQQYHLNLRQDQFDQAFKLATEATDNAIQYQQLYLKANSRLKQWDSMAPFLINLSGVKVK